MPPHAGQCGVERGARDPEIPRDHHVRPPEVDALMRLRDLLLGELGTPVLDPMLLGEGDPSA